MENASEGNEMETSVDKPLTSFQCAALDALMEGKSLLEAAEIAGVSPRTVERWRDENARFKAEYNRWLRQKRATLEGRLLSVADEAVEVVIDAIRKKDLATARALVRDLELMKPAGNGPTSVAAAAHEIELAKREENLHVQERADSLDELELTHFIRRVKRRRTLKILKQDEQVRADASGAA